MKRKILRDAWTEEEAVVGLGVHVLHPRLRELRAHEHREEARDHEEEDRGDDVLDADHLVIRVDPEVVLPRVRAVARWSSGRGGGVRSGAPSSRTRRSRPRNPSGTTVMRTVIHGGP